MGRVEVVAERQVFLLFDRMVAFHVQRGATVPLGAAEFTAGLVQRFPERDGMYFLPDQVSEYDKSRLAVKDVAQFEFFGERRADSDPMVTSAAAAGAAVLSGPAAAVPARTASGES